MDRVNILFRISFPFRTIFAIFAACAGIPVHAAKENHRDMTYTSRDFTVGISAEDYIKGYMDADRFLQYCMECPNYNRSWACPPFTHDTLGELKRYERVLLTATRIIPGEKGLPISDSRKLILPERVRLEKLLREFEKKFGGRSFAFAGNCLYCPEGSCTRPDGKPCRHPELVRSSLEAYGFDIGLTLKNLFDMEILWSTDGKMPAYLTLVCGFFHNCPDSLLLSEFKGK